MSDMASRVTAACAIAVGPLAAMAAGVGVFARGDGASVLVTSVRGETYEMATTGVYANNAISVVSEGIGWDVFTLVVAMPVLLAAAWLTIRGSRRGSLVAAGMFGYFAYMYVEYSVTWAFGPLFPLFVTITALSITGLIAAATLLSGAGIRFTERFPRRSWAVLSSGMALLLTALWAERIATGLQAGASPELFGETTMTVQALDLGLVVPVSLVIAIAAWRQLPAGMVAAAAFGVTFVAMSFAIAAMMTSASMATGVLQLPPIATFTLAGAAGIVIAARMVSSAAGAGAPVPSARSTAEMDDPSLAPTSARGAL